MSSTLRFTVDSEQDGQRIDKFLQQQVEGMSRSQAQKWLAAGQVLVQGKAAGKNDKLKAGMQVEVCLPETALAAQEEDGDECNWGELLAPAEEPQPQQIPLQIVYEDEHLLVVDKPKHMVVHPGAGNSEGTLVNALLYHCGGKLARCNGIERQGIVHRIDKDTSGLLVCAKDDESYLGLSSQIQQHTVDRFYETVVYGKVKQEEGVIDLPIGRSLKDRKKMAVRTGFGCIWHIWVIRWQGMSCMDPKRQSSGWKDSACTPERWVLCIPSPGSICILNRLCRRILHPF